jgi:hypothetical protein
MAEATVPPGVVEKRHVRGTISTISGYNTETGEPILAKHQWDDYVPIDDVQQYMAERRALGWFVQLINPDAHDAGPSGDHGPTYGVVCPCGDLAIHTALALEQEDHS